MNIWCLFTYWSVAFCGRRVSFSWVTKTKWPPPKNPQWGEWYHQDGNVCHSWLHSSSEEELTSIQEHGTTEKILEVGVRLKHPCTTETNRYCIRRIRGANPHWLHCPSYCQHSTTQRGLCFLQWERRAQWVNQPPKLHGLLCESPYSSLTRWGFQVNLQGSTTGNLTVMEWREGAFNTDRGRPNS